MIHRDDLWKLAGLLVFLCVGLQGHYDKLPLVLQPHKDWFEFVGFVGALFNAWRMQPLKEGTK